MTEPRNRLSIRPSLPVNSEPTSVYVHDLNPKDTTIGGSSEIFASGEVQITQLGVGGNFHWQNVRGRLMTRLGLYSQTTPRDDARPGGRPMELPLKLWYRPLPMMASWLITSAGGIR